MYDELLTALEWGALGAELRRDLLRCLANAGVDPDRQRDIAAEYNAIVANAITDWADSQEDIAPTKMDAPPTDYLKDQCRRLRLYAQYVSRKVTWWADQLELYVDANDGI